MGPLNYKEGSCGTSIHLSFSSFDGLGGQVPVNTASNLINSNDAAVEGAYTVTNSATSAKRQVEAQIHKDNALYGNTFPAFR